MILLIFFNVCLVKKLTKQIKNNDHSETNEFKFIPSRQQTINEQIIKAKRAHLYRLRLLKNLIERKKCVTTFNAVQFLLLFPVYVILESNYKEVTSKESLLLFCFIEWIGLCT